MTENGTARERATQALRRVERIEDDVEQVRTTHSKQVVSCAGRLATIEANTRTLVKDSAMAQIERKELTTTLEKRSKEKWLFWGAIATGVVNLIITFWQP